MTSRQLILLLVILIGIGILFTAGRLLIDKPSVTPSPTPTATVDGALKTTMGSKVSDKGLTITPLEVLEDSRCPANANCIQAGTVRLLTEIAGQATTSRRVLTLNQPLSFGTQSVTLTQVSPQTSTSVKIKPGDYMFIFEVK